MDNVGTNKTGPSIVGILAALVVGLIVGFFLKGGGGSHKPTLLGGDPCGSGSGGTNTHQVDVNDANQPCIEVNLDSTKSETVIWSAPADYHPYVLFRDPKVATPVVSGNTATWKTTPAPNGQPTIAWILNIIPTKTPIPPQYPAGQPTPTPGLYGRIIIKP